MFWDNVAGVYDVFVNVINRKTHAQLKETVSGLIGPRDTVLECACGTGMLSEVIAPRCAHLTATDFSRKMLKKAEWKCRAFKNVEFRLANILALDFPDDSFDAVVAANVIHLLDEPVRALKELNRVCKPDGRLIIPTYMNRDENGNDSGFSTVVGKAGADFKREFNPRSYRQFFEDLGWRNGEYTLIEGRIPCAVAVLSKENHV